MWLPFLLLALMASGSACPDLCECCQSDSPNLVRLKCRGRAPGLSELPATVAALQVDGAESNEVLEFFEQLDASESLEDFLPASRPEDNSTILPYIRELSFTNCSLVSLNSSWLGFERLRSLNLSRNSLARLSDVSVDRVTNMSELARYDLAENTLQEVSAGAFRTLPGLVRLSLRKNVVGRVHEDGFRGLDRLEFLDLSDNKLQDLPDSALTPLHFLQKLDLSGNQLQVLGATWFESLERLRELDVSRNGLARAAAGTLQPLPGLSVLKLSENPLRERDVSLLLGTGRRLETVDASHTGLARVPAALTRSVRALRLAGNKLTSIRGGDLDSYPLLRILDLSENRLLDVEDDALGRLEVLEELDISGNILVKIPGSLPGSLTKLRIERNVIAGVRLEDLQGLYNLRSLSLNENDISEIEVGALGQLPALEELDLSDNPIKTLPANTLSGPSNLARLRMSGLTSLQREQQEQSDMAFPMPAPERLQLLDVSRSPVLARQLLADDAALSACKSLLRLNLSQTNVTRLRFDLPYMLPQLRTLDLSGNDWNCSEELYWLGEWLRQHGQLNKDVQPGQCSAPRELLGSPLNELPMPPTPLLATVPTTLTISIGPAVELASYLAEANESSSIDRSIEANDTSASEAGDKFAIEPIRNGSHKVPTSARNIAREQRRQVQLGDHRASEMKNSIVAEARPTISETEEPGTLDNRIDGRRQKSKLAAPNKITFSKLSKLATLKEEGGGKKYSKRLSNPTKGNSVSEKNAPDSNTIAEELNSRATDSDARVSEALSAGAHPGMLVLAGAALGAAAALTVVLSRRATVRRRDRYHRHENIEVHTLTPTTELW